ncbi:hypothetical protein IT570_12980 [Candidatus Sumerlaeota bacterium]|nr:hypothetical protein [Candidatus Sumerlaeota bacterium]
MPKSTLTKILLQLANHPTAPYREREMANAIEHQLHSIPGVLVDRDAHGNIIARLTIGLKTKNPWAFVAHMDHPGFLVDGEQDKNGRVPVVFEGYVEDEYFKGAKVRLFRNTTVAANREVVGVVEKVNKRGPAPRRNRQGWVRPLKDASGCEVGMWDLPAMRFEDDLIYGRNIDDLAGVALIIEMMRRVSEDGRDADVIGLFTRAEEAGFRGALALCEDKDRNKYLPPASRVVSVEMSSARPHIKTGEGAVLRVGDRTTVFDPQLCLELEAASARIAKAKGRRPLRRALMDGGSCEATAFNLYGFRATGVCLPLGNYHNMDVAKKRIAEEVISRADAEDLVAMMTELCCMGSLKEDPLEKLRKDLRGYAADGRKRLLKR